MLLVLFRAPQTKVLLFYFFSPGEGWSVCWVVKVQPTEFKISLKFQSFWMCFLKEYCVLYSLIFFICSIFEELYHPKFCPIFVCSWLCWFKNMKTSFEYRKVASSSPSRIEPHAGLFRLLMKGIFDPYVLWTFDKKLIS